MDRCKNLFLGSAAALATAAGAQAADLPVRKAAPVAVEYVRVCSTYGAGFFVLPGTETCLRIGGRVRAEILVQDRTFRGQDYIGMRARGRINIDARTPTPYGVLRAFVGIESTRDSGSPYTGFPGGVAVNNTNLRQAFVQFAGLTAGRVTSFFSNSDLPTGFWGTLRFDDVPDVTLFAYTLDLGNGLTASASAEDPFARRTNSGGIISDLAGRLTGIDPVTGLPVFTRTDVLVPGINQGGQEFPDFVGNVKYVGTWGNAQISGAVHQIVDAGANSVVIGAPGGPIPAFGAVTRRGDDEIGFAVAGYLSLNLPKIAAGDAAFLAVTYADGAIQYVNGNNGQTGGFGGNNAGFGGNDRVGTLPLTDAYVDARGRVQTTEAFSVAAGYRHFWIPSLLRSNIFGSFFHFDGNGGSRVRPAGTTLGLGGINISGTRFGFVDFDEYRIGGNLVWSPVPAFDIGVEVLYARIETENPIVIVRPGFGAQALRARVANDEDLLEARFRVQRDF